MPSPRAEQRAIHNAVDVIPSDRRNRAPRKDGVVRRGCVYDKGETYLDVLRRVKRSEKGCLHSRRCLQCPGQERVGALGQTMRNRDARGGTVNLGRQW